MYAKLRTNKIAGLLIIGIRFLIGFAFIPSGLVKLIGERFTQLGPETPIGYFFDALYQSGLYWNFLGFCQLLTALLLFTQRFATLGALFFIGIIMNIFTITISLHFTGTWVITMLMLFAGIILIAWDWYKLKSILGLYPTEDEISRYSSPSTKWQITGLVVFIVAVGLLLLRRYYFY